MKRRAPIDLEALSPPPKLPRVGGLFRGHLSHSDRGVVQVMSVDEAQTTATVQVLVRERWVLPGGCPTDYELAEKLVFPLKPLGPPADVRRYRRIGWRFVDHPDTRLFTTPLNAEEIHETHATRMVGGLDNAELHRHAVLDPPRLVQVFHVDV